MGLKDRMKKILRRERNRAKEMAIVAKKTEEVLASAENSNESIVADVDNLVSEVSRKSKGFEGKSIDAYKHTIEKVATPIVTKVIGKATANASLAKQCQFLHKMLNMLGIIEGRARFLGGFQSDIDDKWKAGQSKDEIVNYYWSEPAFLDVWGRMQLEKIHLETMVDDSEKRLGSNSQLPAPQE